ncbi:hypothetical protein BCON_0042g00300 [Botryotinia convoluta]|uniref:Heterokaryon incompatibility domain-containing protein n=1 Tax=Botryotinia convoluta TaxID=54673 RepID=A0A4Z1ISN7_9HELO|nr:hypothetical protein BCON_0042g00300 [Botryotinia convoluta]
MPTRFIDVGTSNISVKLIETKNVTGRFATLSYCWGDSTILEDIKLTQNPNGILAKDFVRRCYDYQRAEDTLSMD